MSFPIIRTFEKLTEVLVSGVGYGGIPEVLEAFQPDQAELEGRCSWNKSHYCRVPLATFPSVEALLVCWEPGQKTTIHNYDGQAGWIKVLHGELLEETFRRQGDLLDTANPLNLNIKAGKTTFMDDELGFHRFSNAGKERTISLHIYADSIAQWTEYNEETGAFLKRTVSYDTISATSKVP